MAQEAQAQAFLQQARVSSAGPLPTFMGEGLWGGGNRRNSGEQNKRPLFRGPAFEPLGAPEVNMVGLPFLEASKAGPS